jgi:hypothetical protein
VTSTTISIPVAGGGAFVVDQEDADLVAMSWSWSAKGAISYPQTSLAGRKVTAHRLIVERALGPIPHGRLVMHNNDIPADCRRENLRIGTTAQNAQMRRSTRLSAAKVAGARTAAAAGVTIKSLARMLGVAPSTAFRAVRGSTWRQVQTPAVPATVEGRA